MGKTRKNSRAEINLPSPPAIAVRILEAVKKEETSFDELSRIITADPALAAKILKAANSPIYNRTTKVDSIQRALTVIGSNALKNIALSFVIADKMKSTSDDAFDFDFFWKRSVTAAVSGELIASLIGKQTDDVFVTSLLQDIGVVIMYLSNPADYLTVLEEKAVTHVPLIEAEKKVFGFDHQEIGMEVLKEWGLPESIYEPVGIHHDTGGDDAGSGTAAEILYLSDKVSSVYHGSHSVEKMEAVKELLSSWYGIEQSRVNTLTDSVADHSIQIMSFFNIDPGDMKPFTVMLQEANEALGKVNLSYEKLVLELKQAKEKAEKTAAELHKANEKLRELAVRDGLTNLYNHRYFQEQMEKEFSRAQRYKHHLTLIMIDIDHFKKYNDTYGHPRGDVVLKKVADTLLETVRTSDIAARYGGEEFAIALPETDLKGGVILSERLRKRVEQLELEENGQKVNITVSIGLTTWEPGGKPVQGKASIITAADRALYKSKHKGRNTISYVAPELAAA